MNRMYLGVSIVSFVLALNPDSSVLDLGAYAWARFGASFDPTSILSLFWKGMSRNGALAGISSSGLTVINWKSLNGGIFDLYEIVPGFIISMLAILIFSNLGSKPTAEMIEEFENVG